MKRIFVSDEIGQLKKVEWNATRTSIDAPMYIDFGSQTGTETPRFDRSRYIQILSAVTWPDGSQKVAIARKGGWIQVVDPKTNKILREDYNAAMKNKDAFCTLQESFGDLVSCTVSGVLTFTALVEDSASDDEQYTHV